MNNIFTLVSKKLYCLVKIASFITLIIGMFMLTSCATTDVSISENTKESKSSTKVAQNKKGSSSKAVKDEDSSDNLIDSMSAEEIREVNIFLSNFSEAYYKENSGFYSDAEEKIDFAYIHALINYSNTTFFEDNYMGIKATDVDTILKRFFGTTVPHKTPINSDYWIYKDGKFLMPSATGESYARFSIAFNMIDNSNGTFNIEFNMYHDPSAGGAGVITDKSVYSLNNDEALDKYDYLGHGEAVVKEKVHNGSNTYELISYSVN